MNVAFDAGGMQESPINFVPLSGAFALTENFKMSRALQGKWERTLEIFGTLL